MRRGGAPAISIKRPTAGSRFSGMLKVAATAKDNNGIDRVGFWLDNHWVATDRTAPYALRARVPKGTRFRSHTLTVRAFSPDGQISSLSVTLKRVRHAVHSARAGRSAAWRLSAKPSKRGTALRGSGTPRHRVKVYLARCTDPSGRVAKRLEAARRREGQGEQELRARATSAPCACSRSRASRGGSPRRSAPAHRRGRVRSRDVALRLAGPVGVGLPHRAVDAVEHVGVVEPLDLVVDRARRR